MITKFEVKRRFRCSCSGEMREQELAFTASDFYVLYGPFVVSMKNGMLEVTCTESNVSVEALSHRKVKLKPGSEPKEQRES